MKKDYNIGLLVNDYFYRNSYARLKTSHLSCHVFIVKVEFLQNSY